FSARKANARKTLPSLLRLQLLDGAIASVSENLSAYPRPLRRRAWSSTRQTNGGKARRSHHRRKGFDAGGSKQTPQAAWAAHARCYPQWLSQRQSRRRREGHQDQIKGPSDMDRR